MSLPHSHKITRSSLREIKHFEGCRDAPGQVERLGRVREAARALRSELLSGPQVRYYRSFDLASVWVPTRDALLDACTAAVPYVHLVHRVVIVQLMAGRRLVTLLISPADSDAARQPLLVRYAREQRFGETARRILEPQLGSVQSALQTAGIDPESVDYITYSHLHRQNLRYWLGTSDHPGVFPNARLIVTRQEWANAAGPLPPQRDAYLPCGVDSIPPDRVLLFDGDAMLGRSVAFVRTPGHTEGNHSIVVHTPEGLMVTSQNGIGPDAYEPRYSRIPGLATAGARVGVEDDVGAGPLFGMEVIPRGARPENAIEQYISMVKEKEIAGPSFRDPDFPNVVVSSELTAFWLFPGVRPTFAFGTLEFGKPALRRKRAKPKAGIIRNGR